MGSGDQLWQSGRQLLIDGRHAEAVQLFSEVARERPLTGDEAHYYGRSLLEAGDVSHATKLLAQAEDRSTEAFWASLFLGRALCADGQPKEGLAAIRRAMTRGTSHRYFLDVAFNELVAIAGDTRFAEVRADALQHAQALFRSVDANLFRANLSAMMAASPDSCFRVEVNGETLFIPVYTILSNLHCVHGLGDVLDTPPKLLTEIDQLAWMQAQLSPGGVFLDVGAMCGVISLPIARLHNSNVRVVAFEPARRALQALKRTLEVNHIENIEVAELAVTDQTGTAQFSERELDETGRVPWLSQTSTITHGSDDHRAARYEVQTTTLDQFFEGREDRRKVAVIKIDVEGFEVAVIEGAARLLSEVRPSLSIDIHDNPLGNGTTEGPIRRRLSALDYRFDKLGHALVCHPL